jgi:hypothetical protein
MVLLLPDATKPGFCIANRLFIQALPACVINPCSFAIVYTTIPATNVLGEQARFSRVDREPPTLYTIPRGFSKGGF